jgi:hypothetical protein
MANLDGSEATEYDVADSAHADGRPEFEDAPVTPSSLFREQVVRVCHDVSTDCANRARTLIAAGVTNEQLLGELVLFVEQKARRLKPPGGRMG